MATLEAALSRTPRASSLVATKRPARIDIFLLLGILIAVAATVVGLSAAGVSWTFFIQPVAASIVLGGTFGVMLVTTPRYGLLHSLRRVMALLSAEDLNRAGLIHEIVEHARNARRGGGILTIEPLIPKTVNPELRHALELMMDVTNRAELRSVLETELQMTERQGEADAKTLEVAGGFAPTLGIIGTVIGLIHVLRQFSNLPSVGSGIGMAFVSTVYGLALANIFLLPLAHRIRARVAENFENQELIMEGVLGIANAVHPSVIRMRLTSFLRARIGDHDTP